MTSGDLFELRDKVLALFSSLFGDVLFESDIDGRDSRGAGQRITTGGRGVNKGIAVHDTPDFGRGHEGTNGHDAPTESFSRSDNIGCNVPMLDPPKFSSAPHTCLHFIGDQ